MQGSQLLPCETRRMSSISIAGFLCAVSQVEIFCTFGGSAKLSQRAFWEFLGP